MNWGTQQVEQIFIGSIFRQPSRIREVEITENYFVSENHHQVFRAIIGLDLAGDAIDIFSVGDSLSGNIHAELAMWTEAAFVDSFFFSAQNIIKKAHKEREIKKIIHALDEDYDIDTAIQSLMDLDNHDRKYTHTLGDCMSAAIKNVEARCKSGELPGITTGLGKLDSAIAGLQSPDLYVIGGRPSMGKTAVVINLMLNNNCPVGFFSTEQPMEQIGIRSISAQGGVSAQKIRSAKMDESDWPKLIAAASIGSKKNIFIHDKPSITISELMSEGRKLKYNHDIQVLYVDYIQRVKSPRAESRRLEVADVVTGLKTLARELDIPVVALAQVSREVQKRTDKRPNMGDLLESGVIEQEADVVMLLYRDEVYNDDTKEPGVIEFIIDKNRHGPTGKLKFAWIGDQMKIDNLT